MNFAEKSRMPVDSRKVQDMLRHQHEFREKVEQQLPNYEEFRREKQFQYGCLTYVAESAFGELRELMDEVKVKREYLPFMNLTDLRRK